MPTSRATARSDRAGRPLRGELAAGRVEDLLCELGTHAGPGSGGGGHAAHAASFRERWQESRAVLLTIGVAGADNAVEARALLSVRLEGGAEHGQARDRRGGRSRSGRRPGSWRAAGPRGRGGLPVRAGTRASTASGPPAVDAQPTPERSVTFCAVPASSSTAPTRPTTRTGAWSWPPLAASLLQAAGEAGADYVIMGNLYGYGPVTGPMTPELPLLTSSANGLHPLSGDVARTRLAADHRRTGAGDRGAASDFIGPGFGSQLPPR